MNEIEHEMVDLVRKYTLREILETLAAVIEWEEYDKKKEGKRET